ncbi:MAG: hypothetical protein ACKOW9_04760 [Candidatus Paceibacterota bacterium]
MILFLMILVLLTTLTSTLAITLESSSKNARESAARNQARSLGLSIIESAYAEIFKNPEEFSKYINTSTRLESTFSAPALDRDGNPTQELWYAFEESNQNYYSTSASLCTDFNRDCARLTINAVQNLGNTTSPREVLIRVSTRVDCRGAATLCVYSSFEQRLRKAQIYDYLYFNDSASLSTRVLEGLNLPINLADCQKPISQLYNAAKANTASVEQTCLDYIPAFTKNDVIKGKTYLNDDFILICPGQKTNGGYGPEFNGSIHVAGSGLQSNGGTKYVVTADNVRTDPGCALSGSQGNNLPSAAASPIKMKFPTDTDLGLSWSGNPCDPAARSAASLAQLPTDSPLRAAADNGSLICITGSGSVNITFTPTGVLVVDGVVVNQTGSILSPVSGAPVSQSYNGKLLYVNVVGKAVINGSYQGYSTVVTKNAVEISNNLVKSSPASALAVIASDEIDILQTGGDITVQGVLVSLNQSVLNKNWNVPGSVSKFIFSGTLAGKYRTVLGSYDANTGQAVTGFEKDLTWDSSASNQNIPYLPTPKSDGWLRLGLSEVKYQS